MLSTQEQPNHPHQELPTGSAQHQEGQHQDPQSLSELEEHGNKDWILKESRAHRAQTPFRTTTCAT